MTAACNVITLSKGYPKAVPGANVSIELEVLSHKAHVIIGGFDGDREIDKVIDLLSHKYFYSGGKYDQYWKITYLEFLSSKAAKIEVCHYPAVIEPEPDPEEPEEPEDPEVPKDPEAPEEPEEGGGVNVDYSQIRLATKSIVSEYTKALSVEHDLIADCLEGLTGGIKTLSGSLEGLKGSLTEGFKGVKEYINESVITPLRLNLFFIWSKLDLVSSKIDCLEIPTLKSITEAFKAMSADIALEIINTIWDEIERRYEK